MSTNAFQAILNKLIANVLTKEQLEELIKVASLRAR